MEEPPEAIFEEGAHHHLIVAFPNVTSVDLILDTIVSSQILIKIIDSLHRVITNLFVEDGQTLLISGIELVFLRQHSAHMKDQLLFDSVCIFTNFKCRWHQLILGELHA